MYRSPGRNVQTNWTCYFILSYSSVAPGVHFKQKNENDHRNRLGRGKGRQKCLQVANRKKKWGHQGLRKAAHTFINKQRVPWNNLHVCLCSYGAMWSSGLTNWESRAWVLRLASDELFCTAWPWAGWIWAGFLDLRDRQPSRLPGSMFGSREVAKGWRALLQPKQDCPRWTIYPRSFHFTGIFYIKHRSSLLIQCIYLFCWGPW